MFVVCHFEEVARSHTSVFVRHLVGAGGIAHKFAMRGTEVLRTVVVKILSGPRCNPDEFGTLNCEAGKSPSRGEMYAFLMHGHGDGYSGDGRAWIFETLERAKAWPSLVRARTDDHGNPCRFSRQQCGAWTSPCLTPTCGETG